MIITSGKQLLVNMWKLGGSFDGTPATIALYDPTLTDVDTEVVSGAGTPDIEATDFDHTLTPTDILDGNGDIRGFVMTEEQLVMTWTFVPKAGTEANALKQLGLPKPGSYVKVTGAPVIEMGNISDALNYDPTGNPSVPPWWYMGSTPSAPINDKVSVTMVLRKLPGIKNKLCSYISTL